MFDPVITFLTATFSPLYLLALILLADHLGLDSDVDIPPWVFTLRPHAVLIHTVCAASVLDVVFQSLAQNRSGV